MPTPPSPARKAMLAVLADGEWHDRDLLLAVAGRAVPPGRAFRVGEAQRQRRTDRARTRGNNDTAIAAGRRIIAREVLTKLADRLDCDGNRYRLRADR